MSLHSDEQYRPMLNELSRIEWLLERNQYEEARDACVKLKARCQAIGIRSSQLMWSLAVASDCLGDFETALESIQESVRLDPMNTSAWRTYGVIVQRMRETLTDEARKADDPLTPKLYHLLITADEATTRCHVAMGRHLHATNQSREALRLLEAVTIVSPSCAEAWTLLKTVAQALGEKGLEREAETEAAMRSDGRPIPFTMMGRAEA